jgi:intraflagellar transport protein 88
MGYMRTSSRMGVGTSSGQSAGGARPMTAVRAAGYSSRGRPGAAAPDVFDPFNQAGNCALLFCVRCIQQL